MTKQVQYVDYLKDKFTVPGKEGLWQSAETNALGDMCSIRNCETGKLDSVEWDTEVELVSPDIVEEHETDIYDALARSNRDTDKWLRENSPETYWKGKELNKENLEALGWTYKESEKWGGYSWWNLGRFNLQKCEEKDVMWCIEEDNGDIYRDRYLGKIPDIAALRQLMIWLEINTNKENK